MILPFKTQWGNEMPKELRGKPTYFIEKIWISLIWSDPNAEELQGLYLQKHRDKFIQPWDIIPPRFDFLPFGKSHTIRSGNRWKIGMKIHPVINNRSADYFQFAPVLRVESKQRIFMTYEWGDYLSISIDGKEIDHLKQEELARRDGFDSYDHFFDYFYYYIQKNEDKQFSGQIIHWTNFRY